jgi:hypothetical protein
MLAIVIGTGSEASLLDGIERVSAERALEWP